jgi:hypothetical protein
LLVCLCSASAQAKDEFSGVERIVAVGDVHGDFAQFTTLLRQAGLIDEDNHWIGGQSHLVQSGDLLDRWPDSRKVVDLLRELEKQAPKAGGYVHALAGNHEAMNVYGDLRYVHPGEFAAFRTKRSEQLLETLYENHVRDLKKSPPPGGPPDISGAYRRQWFELHPPGWVEHRQAFSLSGAYGKWVASRPIVVKIDDTLFLHGGISPKYVDWSIADINKRLALELNDFSLLREGILIDSEGPLWYRGLAQNPEAQEAPHVDAVLASFGVRRIVIGHTPTNGAVVPRLSGRVIQIDVGLSAAHGGHMACLIIEGGKIYALHRGAKLELPATQDALPGYLARTAALDAAAR